jgi:hypothetical protein
MRNLSITLLFLVLLVGCKKEDIGPDLQLKSGGNYTSGDIIAAPGSTLVIGINAYKTEDNLNLFYTEVAYDGANTGTLVSRVWVGESEKERYSSDVTVTLRNTVGIERWIFNINDSEGRITKKEIRVSVQ